MMLVFVALTARAIDEYQFRSGTAVLKGCILNKPADEWNIISVNAHDLFTGEELVYTIPVAADGTFEGSIYLPHSQSVLAEDVSDIFFAVGAAHIVSGENSVIKLLEKKGYTIERIKI